MKTYELCLNSIRIIMQCRCARKQMINQRAIMRDLFFVCKASSLGLEGYGVFHLAVPLPGAFSMAN